MKLTVVAIRNAQPGPRPVKLFDGGGLYLLVTPAGGKLWRLKYRHDGKEGLLAVGTYPEVSLKQARERRDEARRSLAAGLNPSRKAAAEAAEGESFAGVAQEWYARHSTHWTPKHRAKVSGRLNRDLLPWLGGQAAKAITAPDLLAVLRRIEARGALEVAHRALQDLGRIFRYAIATGRADRNPATDLVGALPPIKVRHRATLTTPQAVGSLWRAIKGYRGGLETRVALQLGLLTFVRPGELRQAEWGEIDLAGAEWRIPAEKMKMRSPHIVPLSRQAVEALREVRPLTGRGRYAFPSQLTPDRPMSENTVNGALRRMGYGKDELCSHGFRAIASTLLNEQGWPRDAIERQLAHAERDAVRAAYNYAEHLGIRREIMQAWADYLDSLR